MQQLEEQISTTSSKDITDQAKVIIDMYKYQDNLVGLNQDNGNDINIAINVDRNKIINALEVEDINEVK